MSEGGKKMKVRQIALLLVAVLLLTALPVSAQTTSQNVWKEFYVATTGSDENPGTKEAPFATIDRARNAVREVNSGMQGDIVVNIAGGMYHLDSTLYFEKEDSGKNGYQVIYKGEEGNMPIISGGQEVNGFAPSAKYPGMYEVKVSGVDRINALYINGVRRYLAKSATQVMGVKKPEKYDNAEWYEAHPNDALDNHYNWYDPETTYTFDGMYMSKEDIGFYENEKDIIFSWNENWKSYHVPVQEIMPDPDNSDQVIVRMMEGIWNAYGNSNLNTANNPRPDKGFMIMNAIELLDEPGEFYYNRHTGMLYYMPFEDENLETAEVIVPRLDMLIYIEGYGEGEKIENITFTGLQFSYNKWTDWMGVYGSLQGTQVKISDGYVASYGAPLSTGSMGKSPSAVTVQMTKNVDFIGNNFKNISSAAIDLPNGVEESDVVGNAFSDIGDSAIVMGNSMGTEGLVGRDGVSEAPPEDAGELCLNKLPQHRVKASYYGGNNDTRYLAGYASTLDSTNDKFETWLGEYRYDNAWDSDPKAPERGEKSWAMYDFFKPYTISKIALAFDPDYVTPEEKTGYEILVSNDEDFTEGSYKVVARQETPADEVVEYTVNTDEKYRFVMIRTIGATPLAISRAWVFTPDVKPFARYERVKNNNICNNYIDRVGVDILRATGIMLYYAENVNILHNEVTDLGYTAIAFGWGWTNSQAMTGTYNVNCSYNYVHDFGKVMNDGGGIYTLGRTAENTTISNNYITGTHTTSKAIYSDEGTAYINHYNNVAGTSTESIAPYRAGITDNIYKDNYAPHTNVYLHDDARETNSYEDPKLYVTGQPDKVVYSVINSAGLEPEWQHIKNWTNDIESNLYEDVDWYTVNFVARLDKRYDSVSQEARAIINCDNFGTELGQFPIDTKFKLEYALEEFENASTVKREKSEKLIALEDAIAEARDSVQRYTMDETIGLCKKALNEAKPATAKDKSMGLYPADTIDNFKKQVTSLEYKAANAKTKADEYDVLVELEKAYNDFMKKRFSAELLYVYNEGVTDVIIDSENALVTLVVDADTDLTNMSLEFIPDGSAKIADVVEKSYDLTKKNFIAVYSPGNDTYKIWNIKAKYDNGNAKNISLLNSNWYTPAERRIMMNSKNGSYLTASPYAYMSDYNAGDNSTELKFVPISSNDINDFTFIIGARIYDGLDLTSQNAINDRCEVTFNNDEMSVYIVKEGKKTLIDTVKTSLRYNKENTFSYEFNKIDKTTQLVVKVNGEVAFNKVMSLASYGSFFGCYTDKVNIKLY